MRLWIAEKPDAGRKIAAALGGGTERAGSIRVNRNEVVTWAIGHLFESFMPHDYDERWRKWTLADLPIIPKRFLNRPDENKKSQIDAVVRLVSQADEIVIAADAGREGEYIAWEILDYAGWKGPCKRFWTSALNPDGIAKAINNLIDDAEKKPMYIAARLRSAIDWSDGVNFSRAYNLRIKNYGDRVLSIGRVQTATLAILVDRDLEIENFVPKNYYELKAVFDLQEGPLELIHAPANDKRIADRALAEEIARKTRGVPTTLRVEKKNKTLSPPAPFNLTQLQNAAATRWGWGTKKTLDTAQKLYEAGAITYPRTSSGYLNAVMKADMPQHLAALKKMAAYARFADIKPTIRKWMFDDRKVEDHHGIIPTTEPGDASRLGPDAAKLFDLIARRYLAAMMPDAKGYTTSISADIAGYLFKTTGLALIDHGWKAVWGREGEPSDKKQSDEEIKILPPVPDGTRAAASDVEVLAKTTRPPQHFTEATLAVAMESAGQKHDDEEIRELLGECGIGTVATRPDIIEKIKFRGFAANEGKKIISTRRGREFIAIIREEGNRLTDVAATAALEKEMRAVEKDPARAAGIWRDYVRNLREEIERLKQTRPRRKLTPCPHERRDTADAGEARTDRQNPSGRQKRRRTAAKSGSGASRSGKPRAPSTRKQSTRRSSPK